MHMVTTMATMTTTDDDQNWTTIETIAPLIRAMASNFNEHGNNNGYHGNKRCLPLQGSIGA